MYSTFLRFPIAALAALLLLSTGCDSGIDPNLAGEDDEPTVQFASSSVSSSRSVDSVPVEVTISDAPDREVTAELLYANAASETEAAEFGFPNDAIIGDGNGYRAGTVTFPPNAEGDDATATVNIPLSGNADTDEQLDAVFAIQNVEGASIGSRDRFTLVLGAITLLEEGFSDEEADPFTVFDASEGGNNWQVTTFDNDQSPYMEANGFGADEPSNSWLISPAFDFAETNGQTLSFVNARNFEDGGLDQGLLVKVSTDYDGEGNPEDFTWTDITNREGAAYSEGGYEFVSTDAIDISDEEFQEEEVYIAFQYISSGTGGGSTELWQVDDILVRAQ
ncbi:MAG: choice-of-anchor J domain-containing protein [Longimonas sp.]|uniref:choice-of-anchor J domain-containing protein n=1 Tax=Longimonas sp. TaxID=2039626 RepID=UPI0039768A26